MRRRTLWLLWGAFYIICAGLGFIPQPRGIVRGMLFALSVLFFVPPALLLYEARKAPDPALLRRLRCICMASLILTLLLLIGNILSAPYGGGTGMAMHILLGLVSAPMYCSNYYAVPLFLWAVVLNVSFMRKKERE